MGQRIVWGSPRGHFLDVLLQALPLTGSVPLRRLSETISRPLFVTVGVEMIILVLPPICHLVISIRTKEREGSGSLAVGLLISHTSLKNFFLSV